MRKWVCAACAAVAIGAVAVAMLSQPVEPAKSQPTEIMTTPLAGDGAREVKIVNVILPPGADSGRHFHHGDQCTTVQEGEIKITVGGAGDHVLKAGQALHIDAMTVNRNLSGQPARTTEFFIVAKDQPLVEKSD